MDLGIAPYLQYGTTAERTAFTPAPPTGVQITYLFYDTDLNALYAWDGAAFVPATVSTGVVGDMLDAQFLRTTATQTISASTALVNDNVFTLAIGANQVWTGTFNFIFTGTTGGDATLGLNVPSGATGIWSGLRLGTSETSTTGGTGFSATTDLTDTGIRNIGTVTAALVYAQMIFTVVNGANAGNIQLRIAQLVATGTLVREPNCTLVAFRWV